MLTMKRLQTFDLDQLIGRTISGVKRHQGTAEGKEYLNDILQLDFSDHSTVLLYTKLDTRSESLVLDAREVPELWTCPFCGSADIEVKEWHGGGPEKHLVGCNNDGCEVSPSVTGETLDAAVATWNHRA